MIKKADQARELTQNAEAERLAKEQEEINREKAKAKKKLPNFVSWFVNKKCYPNIEKLAKDGRNECSIKFVYNPGMSKLDIVREEAIIEIQQQLEADGFEVNSITHTEDWGTKNTIFVIKWKGGYYPGDEKMNQQPLGGSPSPVVKKADIAKRLTQNAKEQEGERREKEQEEIQRMKAEAQKKLPEFMKSFIALCWKRIEKTAKEGRHSCTMFFSYTPDIAVIKDDAIVEVIRQLQEEGFEANSKYAYDKNESPSISISW